MPVIYTLIARPPDGVLIDQTNPAHTGNFTEISKKILANIPPAQQADQQKVTFVFEGHTFNFRADRGLMFMCMCDEAYGRSKPFLFLKDIIDTYFLMFSGEETVLEGSTARSFKGVLLQKIKNYSDPPATTSLSAQLAAESGNAPDPTHDPKMAKMKRAKAELDSVATSAKENVQKLIDRNFSLDGLLDRTQDMRESGIQFMKTSRKLNQRLCWENARLKIMMGLVILCGLYLIAAVMCGHLNLQHCV